MSMSYLQHFINKHRSQDQAAASKADIAHPEIGKVIAYYTYARYANKTEYEQKAEDLLQIVLSSLSKMTPLRQENGLLGLACGLIYLLRNNMVEGEEDELLSEIDEWLFNNFYFLIENKSKDWYDWLYYIRLRINYVRRPEQELQGLIFQQNLMFILDYLTAEIQKGWIPDDDIMAELKWIHEQKIFPHKTAIALGLNSPPKMDSVVYPINDEKVTFLIPLRIDSEERERNLDIVLEELSRMKKVDILIMEGDVRARYRMKKYYPHVHYIFIEDTSHVFHITKYRNRLLKEAKSEIVVFWDTDVITPIEQIENAIMAIKNGSAAMSFPYGGSFHMLPETATQIFDKSRSYETLLSQANSYNFPTVPYSVGGAFFVNKQNYLLAGGENEYFYGWGPEDVERVKRMEILGLPVYRTPGPLFHLYHPRKMNSTYTYKDLELQNRREYLKVCSMLRTELTDYIQNWTWLPDNKNK